MQRAFIFISLFATNFAFAQSDESRDLVSPEISSFEAGVVCPPEPVAAAPAPGTIAGTTHLIDEPLPFISNTRNVPAVLGIGFGVKAQSVDPAGAGDVTFLLQHPAMGPNRVETQSFQTTISGVAPSLTFYQFDYSYELVTGVWEMFAVQGDAILYRTSFTVVPPELAPELASVCGFEELLSRAPSPVFPVGSG